MRDEVLQGRGVAVVKLRPTDKSIFLVLAHWERDLFTVEINTRQAA